MIGDNMFKAFFIALIICVCLIVDHKIINIDKMTNAKITVEVKGNGAINGLYELEKYSVLNDLVKQIDLKEDADLSSYNLQQPLKNNDVITINVYQEPAKISINNATLDELCTLDGIKEKTAQKIIAYRIKNGPFQSIEELMEVSGIGEAKFLAIKDKICL